MRAFTELCRRLDATTRTNEKVAAVRDYFSSASPADAALALAMLSGERRRRVVTMTELREWASQAAGIPPWLLEECYATVGDLAETLALVLPDAAAGDVAGGDAGPASLSDLVGTTIDVMKGLPAEDRRRLVLAQWRRLGREERFLWHKMLTGGFRLGVARSLVARALADVAGIDPATMAHRLMGLSSPTAEDYARLIAPEAEVDRLRPYPFFLANPLEEEPARLGPVEEWQAEWKWDGMRAQLVVRGDAIALWTRGEELASDAFPEIVEDAAAVREAAGQDGCVIDGELLAVRDGGLLGFTAVSKRIGRTRVGRKLLAEVPCVFVAYDLIEWQGEDRRPRPLSERRATLASLVPTPFDPATVKPGQRFFHSPVVEADSWETLAERRSESRGRGVEGLMLKRKASRYGVGRTRGDWWKWKVEPLEIDAVLLYAQAGHGRRATLHTDYTLGVWSGGKLVPVAKAYSGLSDAELVEVDRIIRRTTLEKHGPVRVVEPSLVFEIAFESVARSSRHKAGLAVRFPRIARWRRDKMPADAGTLEALARMLPDASSSAAGAP